MIDALSRARRSIAFAVKTPCLTAFLFPKGAPDPLAPPCIRQRKRPETAGARQGVPRRVFALHRGLRSMGPKLRGCMGARDYFSDFSMLDLGSLGPAWP